MQWKRLLDGDLARQANDAVDAIAEALGGELDLEPGDEFSLAGGMSGIALLYGYLARAWPERGYEDRSRALRDDSVRAAHSGMGAALYGGVPGIAWTVAHLGATEEEREDPHPNADFDSALCELLGKSPWRGDYDLISGLVGLGVYALERLPDPVAVDCLELVVDRLDELAEHTEAGVTLHTSPKLLAADAAARFPAGRYDLGLAHGVPGSIAMLGAACAAGVAEAKARPLLDGAVSWLLAQELPASGRESRFDFSLAPGHEPRRARTAWCYGEPGIAAALLVAARSVASAEWEAAALETARRAAGRPLEESGVVDAGLCHGAAGLGHIFNRIAQATGDPDVERAARYWFERALAMRQRGSGVAGFSARRVAEDGAESDHADSGLLTGAAGIALALLAAGTEVEPAWDRVLLLSV